MDSLGDRMKMYEAAETSRFMPLLPIIVRIDGRCFSSFSRGMKRPFDQSLIDAFDTVTKRLVMETGALVGYTQSDEISLLLYSPDPKSQVFFDGKRQKIVSVCASLTTSYFIEAGVLLGLPVLGGLSFDCRAFQVPNETEAANAILWREQDATKNAISMAARAYYSHKDLLGKTGPEMQEMLFEKGVNFNDYPARFRSGARFQKRKVFKELPPETLAKIPPEKRPDGPIERHEVVKVCTPRLGVTINREDILFRGAEPEFSIDRAA